MDEDGFFENDDHNHNYREECLSSYYSDCRSRLSKDTLCFSVVPEPVENVKQMYFTTESTYLDSECSEQSSDCDRPAASAGRLFLNSPSKFVMNAMTADDYKSTYWPKLETALEHLLTQSPMDHISISYEQMYSHVYKCVCQQHSELLYNDLIWKIASHLQQVSSELQGSPLESFIEKFNLALTQYTAALQCIVPVFIYMNKFYIETKLNRDLKDDLMKLFSDHVAEKHVDTLIPLLKKADAVPFQVKPSTMASVVKGLYALRPDWAALSPSLFSKFIPQIQPAAMESQLPYYATEDQKLQMELSLNGFSRGDQSRKRASEES